MPESLFTSGRRNDTRPATYSETNFEFLDRVAGDYWQQVRGQMQAWADRLPTEADYADMRARLRAKEDSEQASAFFELYLHEVLLRSGCALKLHPNMGNSSSKPDFLVTPPGAAQTFYLEAIVPTSSQKARARMNRRLDLIDAINRKPHPVFALFLERIAVGHSTLPSKALIAEIHRWLDSLPPTMSRLEAHQVRASFPTGLNKDGWELVFQPMPWTQRALSTPHRRAIGGQVTGGGRAEHFDTIRRALKAKDRKYGKPSLPLVIAIGTTFWGDLSELTNGFYGNVDRDASEPSQSVIRRPNGYFGGAAHADQPQISAVVVVNNLTPWRATAPAAGWHNPWPTFALPTKPALPATWFQLDGMATCEVARQGDMEKLLGLPEGWPIGEPWT